MEAAKLHQELYSGFLGLTRMEREVYEDKRSVSQRCRRGRLAPRDEHTQMSIPAAELKKTQNLGILNITEVSFVYAFRIFQG